MDQGIILKRPLKTSNEVLKWTELKDDRVQRTAVVNFVVIIQFI